ncbi:MAG: glutathione S-transferase [Pseudomonadota bacterium]
MKIYDQEGFPNPARVRMALAEKGLTESVEFVPVAVMEGEHRSPEFRAKNPTATVPVLELEDGSTIAECTAITEYLDHAAGEPTLTGATARQRGEIHMMSRRAEAQVMDAVGAYFHHATPGLGPDIESYQNAEWGEKQKTVAQAAFAYFNETLADRRWLAGDDYSMADITLLAGLAFADFAKIEIPASLTNLTDWRARASARYA